MQILHGLKFLKKHHIIHCDMKPENILLKSADKSDIEIIDIGSSCFEKEKYYTYIQSRFYRAPEIILGLSYNTSIDMWSFGCILAELFTGKALFPGDSERSQLLLYSECLGLPSKKYINMASRNRSVLEAYCDLTPRDNLEKSNQKRTLRERLKCEDEIFLDLIKKCLEWDPSKRITTEEALNDKWIREGLPPVMKRSEFVEGLSTERKMKNQFQ